MARRIASKRNIEVRKARNEKVERRLAHFREESHKIPLEIDSGIMDTPSEYVKNFNLSEARTIYGNIQFNDEDFDRILKGYHLNDSSYFELPMSQDPLEIIEDLKAEFNRYERSDNQDYKIMTIVKNLNQISRDGHDPDRQDDVRENVVHFEGIDCLNQKSLVNVMQLELNDLAEDLKEIDSSEHEGINFDFLYNKSILFAINLILIKYVFRSPLESKHYFDNI